MSEHFGTLCIKRLNKCKVDVNISFNDFYSRFSRFISNFFTASTASIIINFHQKYSCTKENLFELSLKPRHLRSFAWSLLLKLKQVISKDFYLLQGYFGNYTMCLVFMRKLGLVFMRRLSSWDCHWDTFVVFEY